MKPVMEIVNYIRTHALNHRQFRNIIAELHQGLPGDLPLHCTVRWLSKSKVLSRFFELLDAVKLFMEEKDKDYPELSDLEWIMDLAFSVDMLCHLDRLNLTLQASDQVTSAAMKKKDRYATLAANLHKSFVTRFCDLQLKRPQITFLVDPLNVDTDCLKAPLVTDVAAAELEMIDLCEADQLKAVLR
ncbi:general transcription factor II-I repeat domain-containing protein 2A-like isoform X2 [Syngnathoides biaculeatus]|nr:general transcription factor II-I repeat domain-containing protein 2A-like isoform X2 [Syngnathoides biaculeatus]